MSESADRMIGRTIDGRFRLERLLGAGGMGKVYYGVQLSVDRPVAVKVLRSDLSELESIQKRFFREAQVLASLHHPNIVGLVDFGRDDDLGALYMAMHYVEGKPLTDLVRAGRLPTGVALNIARQICSGLIEAHAAGVVHRDLKPDNIMLQTTTEGSLVAKILDFGIALPSGRDETKFTQTGAIMGTPYYMSPEQAQGIPVGPASDLYSAGVILYEMVTGDVPFRGDTPLAVLYKTVNERHTPVHQILERTQESGQLGALIDDLLEKAPSERPTSASEVALRLDACRGVHEVPRVESVEALETLVQPAVRTIPPTETRSEITAPNATQTPQTKGKSRVGLGIFLLVMLFGALLLIAALVAGAIYYLGSDLSGTSSPIARAPEPAEVDEPTPAPAANESAKPAAPDPAKSAKKPEKVSNWKWAPIKRRDRSAAQGACQGLPCNVNLTTKDADYACQSSECGVGCEAGGCNQKCQNGKCEFDCAGGDCDQICMADQCVASCSGGGCDQKCFPGATCNFSCTGGDCDEMFFKGSKSTRNVGNF